MAELEYRVLVVDDNAEDREVYRRVLASGAARYHLRETESGEEGLALCGTWDPDCVLLDYRLPDMDGLEFLERLAPPRDGPGVPIVMLSGAGNEAIAVEAMKKGAADYLVKGAGRDEKIPYAVQAAIERTALRRRLFDASERIRKLEAVTEAALAYLHLDALCDRLLERIQQVLNVDTAVILMLDPAGRELVVHAARGLEQEIARGVRIPVGPGFAGRIAAPGRPAAFDEVGEAEILGPLLREKGIRSLLGAPLMVEGRVTGVVHVGTLEPRRFAADDVELLRLVADRIALALEQARLREDLRRHADDLELRITERTGALREANDELQAFGYTVSHDLQAPLRAMRGFTEVLLEEYADRLDPTARGYLDRVVDAAQRMHVLIKDLLAFSRVGRGELTLRALSLDLIVDETLIRSEALVREREAEVTVEKPLPAVLGDPGMLVHVVTNLVSNALKFVAPGVRPRVRVWADRAGDGVTLFIRDNGIGIAPEYHERVFRVFERLHGGETYAGTGIGLAIVRKAVERMGGSVGVESEPGSGACFSIRLPAAPDEARTNGRASPNASV